MKWIHYSCCALMVAALFFGFWVYSSKAPPAVFDFQESNVDGATISVLPEGVAAENSEWVFGIVMDTHSIELDNNLMESVTLTVGTAEYRPLRWEGDPPGGHHRSGRLVFKAVDPYPQDLTMTIVGIGAPRTFTWQSSKKVEDALKN